LRLETLLPETPVYATDAAISWLLAGETRSAGGYGCDWSFVGHRGWRSHAWGTWPGWPNSAAAARSCQLRSVWSRSGFFSAVDKKSTNIDAKFAAEFIPPTSLRCSAFFCEGEFTQAVRRRSSMAAGSKRSDTMPWVPF